MRRLMFLLERQLLRGAVWRLVVIAVIIVGVSFVGGGLALLVAPEDFPTALDAVWWAFLRLSDPGYLGDDHGFAKRSVSTALTVIGYVLFMGALIAIMAQWLNATLSRLERGETPIVLQGHLLVVGWSERSASIVEEFLFSESRVRGFLKRSEGIARVRVVLLIEELNPTIHAEVKERLGPVWDSQMVILRAGSRLKLEHLERVAFHDAAAIVLPGNHESESEIPGGADTATIKTLMSIAHHPLCRKGAHPPRVVAELNDQRKAGLADFAYPGQLDVIPSDRHLAQLFVQNVLNPGLSSIYADLLSFQYGAALHVATHSELAGLTIREAAERFDRTVLLGVVREGRAMLGLHDDFVIQDDDLEVVIACTYDQIRPGPRSHAVRVSEVEILPIARGNLRILCIGWSERLPSILQEFGRHIGVRVQIDVLGETAVGVREAAIAGYGPLPASVAVRHLIGDYTVPHVVRALDPGAYDSVIVLGSARTRSNEEMDARTLVAYLTLHEAVGETGPPVLVEITDPQNEALFEGRRGEVVVTPRVISNLLAHVTLRRELLAVYDALFRAGGVSFRFRPASAYGLPEMATFDQVRAAAAARGHIAIGVRNGELTLVPPSDTPIRMHEVAVLGPCA